MVATLRAHPEVEVYKVVVRPPATAAAIRKAEKAVGSPLPDDLRAFYLAHDGVFLEWGLREGDYDERTRPFDGPDYGQPPGCINLLPVARAISPRWEQDSHVNEIDDDHLRRMFGRRPHDPPKVRAVCIDNYSMYNHADLVFGPEPAVLVATDHGADMESSDFTSFSVYLDVTLALFGVDRFEHGLGVHSSRRPRRIAAWTKTPKLDRLLAKLDDE
ncbi:SMI1/KNR4 family protein [Nannocystis radixulma]|uniref:SMI1/KNR4 family protein n=1 Tax=Nannocystis radixulma TaxID=2995305 RepID=A0ABT5BHU6_9BACT|nr:SMI1/KNR4 family protein [Nannocystis radixulma]MDC0673729.1 SMI1/KNR4 family protein [Nannocystis radixulma]